MPKDVYVSQKANPDEDIITGRNGTYGITQLIMYTYADNKGAVNGIGKRGNELHAGLYVSRSVLENACIKFLTALGYRIIKP